MNARESGDYPIVLGDSLKNDAPSRSKFLRLRYNWEPKGGFSDLKGTLQRSNGDIRLLYKDDQSRPSAYGYKAVVASNAAAEENGQVSQLALVFDPEKSVYVLEKISNSLDLNLVSARDQSKAEVERYKKIDNSSAREHANGRDEDKLSAADDGDEADPTNPFDFRHFLSEAKENAEKAFQAAGGRTPIAGSRTPISGIPSPSLGPGRFVPAKTTQFRPTPTSAPASKKATPTKPTASTTPKKQATNKRKPPATKPSVSQPLSKEVISDSSGDDAEETANTSRPSTSQGKGLGHNRDTASNNLGRSPHTIVQSGGLEIDMGSPPPETKKKSMIDLDAFRKETRTPTLPTSNRPQPSRHQPDEEMKDVSDVGEDDGDSGSKGRSDVEMDDDVDEIVLDEPRPRKVDTHDVAPEKMSAPPTPQPAVQDDGDQDLEDELFKALGQDDDGMTPPMNVIDDDESEVSEEE